MYWYNKSVLYVFDVKVKKQTEKAIQVYIDNDVLWLPKSKIRGRKKGEREIVILPFWLAEEKGLLQEDGWGIPLHCFEYYTEEELQKKFY